MQLFTKGFMDFIYIRPKSKISKIQLKVFCEMKKSLSSPQTVANSLFTIHN